MSKCTQTASEALNTLSVVNNSNMAHKFMLTCGGIPERKNTGKTGGNSLKSKITQKATATLCYCSLVWKLLPNLMWFLSSQWPPFRHWQIPQIRGNQINIFQLFSRSYTRLAGLTALFHQSAAPTEQFFLNIHKDVLQEFNCYTKRSQNLQNNIQFLWKSWKRKFKTHYFIRNEQVWISLGSSR